MAPRIDPDGFGFLIADIARLMRAEMDRRIAEAGVSLTTGEARTLAHAARAGPVRQNVLAERMGLEPMTLSTYLDRLEAQGFVEREADPADRRAKIVHLTDAAGAVLERTTAIAAVLRGEASDGVSAAEWNSLLELLKQVRANLSANKADPSRGEAGPE